LILICIIVVSGAALRKTFPKVYSLLTGGRGM
jgi:hypothetical protein